MRPGTDWAMDRYRSPTQGLGTTALKDRSHEAKRLTRLECGDGRQGMTHCHVKQAEWIENGFQIKANEKSFIHKKHIGVSISYDL